MCVLGAGEGVVTPMPLLAGKAEERFLPREGSDALTCGPGQSVASLGLLLCGPVAWWGRQKGWSSAPSLVLLPSPWPLTVL